MKLHLIRFLITHSCLQAKHEAERGHEEVKLLFYLSFAVDINEAFAKITICTPVTMK